MLARWVHRMASCGFSVMRACLSAVAYHYASDLKIHGFSNANHGTAGRQWLCSFIQQYHGGLKLKCAKNLAKARAKAVNKTDIDNWFQQYMKVATIAIHLKENCVLLV